MKDLITEMCQAGISSYSKNAIMAHLIGAVFLRPAHAALKDLFLELCN